MDKTLLFIVNPRAGKTKSSAPLFDAVATFGRAGYLVRVMLTQAAGDAARFAAQWGGDYDLVVCAGGDGTLNETLSGLMQLENRPPVGYLPNGSTNDFAMSLHLHTMLPAAAEAAASLRIPSSVQQAARAVVEGTPHPLDLGAHNDRYFSYVASFGAFTKASYSASQETKNALGHFAYILEGIKNLDSLRPYRCAVEADGERFEGEFIFGAVCNSTSLGGLVKLDPSRVRMDDGKFELLLLRMPKTALDLQNLITVMTRMQYDYPGVILRHVRRVTLTTEENLPWSLDGEYCPSAPRVEIENLPAAIQLVR